MFVAKNKSIVTRMITGLWLLLLYILLFNNKSIAQSPAVSIWLTTGDEQYKMAERPEKYFTLNPVVDSLVAIRINDSVRYQYIDGFGAAMTGTSAYVLHNYLDSEKRQALMKELFSPSGLHLTFIRQMIGASGYQIGKDYSYDDPPNNVMDTTLKYFSIFRDEQDVIPMLKLALRYNPNLKLFGSPCSAPAWMKTTGTMRGTNGGRLRKDCYKSYAEYLGRYIDSFSSRGLPIYAITVQNEPEYGPSTYPGMLMSPEEQAEFIKCCLGPVLKSKHPNTKLIIYDHNWGGEDILGYKYPIMVLSDKEAYPYIAGTGFHNYGGTPTSQSTLHNIFPNKDIWFTEGSGGHWLGGFGQIIRKLGSRVLIGSIRNWAKGVCLWNLALDSGNLLQKSKPPEDQNCAECTAVVMIGKDGHIQRNAEYYLLAHASSFVKSGAQRIASDSFEGSIETVAFRNPDGGIVLIALNNSSKNQDFILLWKNKTLRYTLQAGALATFTWSAGNKLKTN